MDGEELQSFLTRYLRLTEERRLDEAQACLAPGARLVFPGGNVFHSLSEMAAFQGGRYRWVKKRIERWDVLPAGEGATTAYCLGTLYGEDLAGRAFDGVRFVDRFEMVGGRIALQEVWNDLGQRQGIPAVRR